MPSFYLAPYSIRVKDLETDDYIRLGSKDEWGIDFLEVLYTYLVQDMPSLIFNKRAREKKTLRREFFQKDGRTITGILKAGEYGFGSDLHNVESDETKYTRQTIDAELIPYFFLAKIPNTTKSGIAIFQKLGNRGFKSIFEKDLNNYLKDKVSSQYRIEISSLVPREMVKHYLTKRIVKIRLIKHSLPQEISDVDLSGIPDEEQGEAEFTLKANRNESFPAKLLDKFRSNIDTFLGEENASVGSILEIKDFQADNVKVEVRVGNSYRTIDLSNVDKLRFSEDITDRVTLNPDSGHPKFEDTKEIAEELASDCAKALWDEDFHE